MPSKLVVKLLNNYIPLWVPGIFLWLSLPVVGMNTSNHPKESDSIVAILNRTIHHIDVNGSTYTHSHPFDQGLNMLVLSYCLWWIKR